MSSLLAYHNTLPHYTHRPTRNLNSGGDKRKLSVKLRKLYLSEALLHICGITKVLL